MRLSQALGQLESCHCGVRISLPRNESLELKRRSLPRGHPQTQYLWLSVHAESRDHRKAGLGVDSFKTAVFSPLALYIDLNAILLMMFDLSRNSVCLLSTKRRVLMIVRRHCGGALWKGRDLHDRLIPLVRNHQLSSEFS